MAKETKKATGEEVVTSSTANNGLTIASQRKEMLAAFEEVDNGELIELTSAILKLEEGEVWNGIIVNEKQTMKSTDEGGEDYEGYVGYDKNMDKTILSDAVVIGTMDEFFAKYPETPHVLVRVSNKGMRKNAKGREYRDLSVRIGLPKTEA